jgi:hypothetical protein
MAMYRKNTEELIKIELISDFGEREFYSDMIARHHYLESSQINSKTLVHVAKRGREEVAIITWEPGTRHWFGFRDKLIGWTDNQRKTRHKYCFENRRFLMLVKENNLASQVLSKSTERLAEDAKNVFGHECMLAETFVDPSKKFEGTCYKAAGWTEAGMTQGGRGANTRSPKKYFIKELKLNALAKLKAPELTPSDTVNPRQSVLSLETFDIKGLRKKLDSVPDPRKHKGWYPQSSLLALIISAVISGKSSISDIHRWISDLSKELLKSLGCRKSPSYGVIRSTLVNIDHQALSNILGNWLSEQEGKIHIDKRIKILSLDGKRLRAASNAGGADIHILELIDSVTQVVKAQIKVTDKENEIPVAQKILSSNPLDAETIVTADALHTQRKTAAIIIKKTLTTSLRSKITKKISEKPSLKIQMRRRGRLSSVLKSLDMEE